MLPALRDVPPRRACNQRKLKADHANTNQQVGNGNYFNGGHAFKNNNRLTATQANRAEPPPVPIDH